MDVGRFLDAFWIKWMASAGLRLCFGDPCLLFGWFGWYRFRSVCRFVVASVLSCIGSTSGRSTKSSSPVRGGFDGALDFHGGAEPWKRRCVAEEQVVWTEERKLYSWAIGYSVHSIKWMYNRKVVTHKISQMECLLRKYVISMSNNMILVWPALGRSLKWFQKMEASTLVFFPEPCLGV